jgi:hypothetical protein
MNIDDRLRLDYDQTTQLLRTLTDIRFKLIALVPTLAGATVGLVGRPRPAAELLAVGLLGLVATLGVLVYELGNSQAYMLTLDRARALEQKLELVSVRSPAGTSDGPFSERSDSGLRLFGVMPVWREAGFAPVYGAALAGWSYLVAWGVLRALDVGGARNAGAAIGAAAGILIAAEIFRLAREKEGSTTATG